MNSLIQEVLDAAEARGFAVSIHPTGTALVKNFRETMILRPLKDGSVSYEVREPLLEPHVRGWSRDKQDLLERLEKLR